MLLKFMTRLGCASHRTHLSPLLVCVQRVAAQLEAGSPHVDQLQHAVNLLHSQSLQRVWYSLKPKEVMAVMRRAFPSGYTH